MWKNLKSIFIVEEDASKSKKKAASKAPAAKGSAPPARGKAPEVQDEEAPATPSGPVTAKVTDKFMKVLLTAMDEADQPGFDYLEFKKVLQGLRKSNMDELTRFTSAYTMAESMGVTPKKLVDSAQHYLQVLKKEDQQFKTALQGQRQAKVGDKLQRQKDLSQVVLQKEAQIKELQAEIKKLDQERNKLQKTIQTDTGKLDQMEANFGLTLKTLEEQISGDVGKMQEYLK